MTEEKFIIEDNKRNKHKILVRKEVDSILNHISLQVLIEVTTENYTRWEWAIRIGGGLGKTVHIVDMRLEPELRGKGLGKKIYLEIEKILKKYKTKQIMGKLSQVDCIISGNRNIRNQFWKELGFKIIETDEKGNGKIVKNI